MTSQDRLKDHVFRGWNTWNNNSVLSHVYLPHGFAVNIGKNEYEIGTTWIRRHLRESLIGHHGKHDEQIHPGSDGSYTDIQTILFHPR